MSEHSAIIFNYNYIIIVGYADTFNSALHIPNSALIIKTPDAFAPRAIKHINEELYELNDSHFSSVASSGTSLDDPCVSAVSIAVFR